MYNFKINGIYLYKNVWIKIFENLDLLSLKILSSTCRIFKHPVNQYIAKKYQKHPNFKFKYLLVFHANEKILKFYEDEIDYKNQKLFKYAIKFANIDYVKQAIKHGCSWDTKTPIYLARFQNIQKLVYNYKDFRHDKKIIDYMNDFLNEKEFKKRNIELSKYVDKYCPYWPDSTLHEASFYNNFECLKYSHKRGISFNIPEKLSVRYFYCNNYTGPIGKAVENENFEMLVFLIENGAKWEHDTSSKAASSSDLKYIKYLRQKGCPWDPLTAQKAAEYQNYKFLKYAVENGCPLNIETFKTVARFGNFEIFKFLHKNNCPWDENITYQAAISGNFECFKYAVDNGCHIHEKCTSPAFSITFEIFKYAHENGCPWNSDTLKFSILFRNNSFKYVKYAHENGCPWDSNTPKWITEKDDIQLLKYVHENGCPWNSEITAIAAKNGNIQILKYAHENGCPWHSSTKESSIIGKNYECLKYCHQNNCQWSSTPLFDLLSNLHYSYKNTSKQELIKLQKCLEYVFKNDPPCSKYSSQYKNFVSQIKYLNLDWLLENINLWF